MAVLLIEHRVRDFDSWKAAFDRDPVGRKQGGVRRYRVARAVDDPNLVLIDLHFDGADAAEAFRGRLEAMWSRVVAEGLIEQPTARLVEEIESGDL